MNIAVLCGGISRERDVSISTGTCVARALRQRGHMVALVDLFLGCEEAIGHPGDVFTDQVKDDLYSVGETEPDLDAVRSQRHGEGIMGPGVLEICKYADIAFLALHGAEGENGKLQACLDLYNIPYTGSGYIGSALAMNKELTKIMLRDAGIKVPKGITLHKGEIAPGETEFPCVVKPCSGGSSVATNIVHNPDELTAALDQAFQCDNAVIIEEYVGGRELTVGIMDGKAMPVIEIIPKTGFYDYKNKYQAGLTDELCPAPLTEPDTARIKELAELAFKALHMEAYGRADFLKNERNGEFYCLELNSLPGMTPTSLIPQMAAAEGTDYGQLCEKIIEVSMRKYKA